MNAHVFAAIAPAPYSLVSVAKSADEIKAGRSQVYGVCAHCGSALINVATFRAADGTEFTVGLDCAKLAGESVAKHAAAAKQVAALENALESFRPIARQVFVGIYMDTRGRTDAAKIMAGLAKLGLATGVKRVGGGMRYFFTPAGVERLGAAYPGLKAVNPETMQPA